MKTQIYVNQPTSRCQRSVAVRKIATEVLSFSLEVESLVPSQWADHIAAGAKSCRKMFVFTNRASIAATQPFKDIETLKNEVIHSTETEPISRNSFEWRQLTCTEIICERRSQRLCMQSHHRFLCTWCFRPVQGAIVEGGYENRQSLKLQRARHIISHARLRI